MLCSHHLLSHFSPLPTLPPAGNLRNPPPPRRLLRLRPSLSIRHTVSGQPFLADLLDPIPSPPPPDDDLSGGAESEEGPVEILTSKPPVFASGDDPSPIQIATSVLLTGAISVFLFRSIRRRARRAKELRLRSSGMAKPKGAKEEALEKLRAMGAAPVEEGAPPSPLQAFLGGIGAGVIALILYKFTLTIEAALNRQAISDNFSVRQITITIRTIVNGLCYLATFVFGINSVGLVLYSVQLALNSMMDNFSSNLKLEKFASSSKFDTNEGQLNSMLSSESSTDNTESRSEDVQNSSNGT